MKPTISTLLTLAAVALSPGAKAAVVLSKDVRGATTWDTFTVTTFDSSTTTSFIAVDNNNETGLGQSFTATLTGNVDAISFGVTRMYANMSGVVTVYQMFDGDGSSPGANPTRFRNGNPLWMSNAIATIPFDTNTVDISSGDSNNMFTFSLTGTDQIAVTSGATYMVSIEGIAGGDGSDLVLWDKSDANPYANGIYGIPDGGTTASGRDAGLAINIVPVPEPSVVLLGSLGLLGLLRRRR